MQTRQLGQSDLMITPIGIGAWAMGGAGWAFSWSQQDDRDSLRAIHAALDQGINWIDTAAVYGLGHSEEVVAKALQGYSGKRPYVFTKCARAWNANREIVKCLKADSIRRECEESLRRLQTDQIDLYQIHWPEPDEDIEEGWATLAALQKEGKVRWIGVSNFDVGQMQRIAGIASITSLQPPYSLIRPEVESQVLPYCGQQNIGVIAYSPMGSGMLTGTMSRHRLENLPADDWRRRSPHFQEPKLTSNLESAQRVMEVARRLRCHPGQVAIAHVLSHPSVTGAIVGFRNEAQVAELVGAAELTLTAVDLEQLRRQATHA
jgi:aryl-alcohol dehydrogenase-like predicted oxidoreductase